ncbi:hypothetical protein ThrDRAFT_01130 [Frankia casuarinae]|nr:hypothetical protein CcI6DRAFT_01098 [Frankia sp. CcI6]EYT93160.1 hypothetical protein ThrDRAFT_01130 [Frankia casuarinae]KDA42723.1 hypothetical protein BMG523Draft_02423 [Frankia sp. BMG5.23]KFB04157.1 hypothetical protein ALLO2DRAFT_03071 [Frankia sp. Allo2]OAA26606.1 hypothetical protein AAY23_102910 [Frankia casuarinae]
MLLRAGRGPFRGVGVAVRSGWGGATGARGLGGQLSGGGGQGVEPVEGGGEVPVTPWWQPQPANITPLLA